MKAEVISIGTELIIGHTVNTNATYISELLNSIGISVHYHTSVGDNEARIVNCLREACSRSDLIILTGGLGPTDDDITHDVLARFTGLEISQSSTEQSILEEKYSSMGGDGKMPQINYKQSRVIAGAQVIDNPIGTAIGMYFNIAGSKLNRNEGYSDKPTQVIFASFPGVPCEMEAMLESILPKLKQELQARDNSGVIVSKKIKFANLTESRMAQTIVDHYQKQGRPNPFEQANPSLAPYAGLGEVYLRLTAHAATEAEAYKLLEKSDQELHELFPNKIFGYDNDTIESVLASKLRKQGLSIAFAESCTGGFASKLMTDLAGASDYTKLNIVSYANEAKMKILGVKAETLEAHGAVSEECAREMVVGLTRISDCDINVSITGIAGPDGATPEKPIGTIYVGVIIRGKAGLYINTENNGEVLHEEGFYVYLRKLDWTARRLSREQVRELACKKIFWLVYNLIA